MKTAIATFVRVPVLGKVKTRLANKTSDEFALVAYQALLKHTFEVLKKIENVEVFIFVTPYYLSDVPFNQMIQKGEDLGEKLFFAGTDLFDLSFDSVVFIGSDCPSLDEHHINDAISKLSNNDVVIGPATDGGYYLLGMKKMYPFLFENMPWSTEYLLEETLKKTQEHQLKTSQLTPLSDVDEWEDLEPFLDQLKLSPFISN